MLSVSTSSHRGQSIAAVDLGLRSYLLGVYNYMASGVLLTGIVSYLLLTTGLGDLFFSTSPRGGVQVTGLGWLAVFAPLVFVFVLSYGVDRFRLGTVQLLFWSYCAVFGISLSMIFMTYTATSIARTFFIAAATFAAMSIYGFTTKSNLARMGTYLLMALIGIIIASLVNLFLGSTLLQFIVSIAGVLVFTVLTAVDAQAAMTRYQSGHATEKSAVYDALNLYLDFVNLFTMLLRLTGSKE